MKVWHLYMVRGKDGRLYTGVATDVGRRLAEHEGTRGRGAKSLRGRGPLDLAFQRRIGGRALALKIEHRIKHLTKKKKEELIENEPDTRQLLRILDGDDPEKR